jgi:hypothetical protein
LKILYLLVKHLEQLLRLLNFNSFLIEKNLHFVKFVSQILDFLILIFAYLRNLAVVIKVVAVSFSELILQSLEVCGRLKLQLAGQLPSFVLFALTLLGNGVGAADAVLVFRAVE